MKLSKKAEETLYKIVQNIDKLERHGVEVSDITISLQLATYEEERKIAKILELETAEYSGVPGSYTLKI